MKEYIKSRNYKLISKEYKNNRQKLVLKDMENYFYTINYDNFKKGVNPNKFGSNNPYTIQNIKLWCKLNNKSFKLLSDTYINAKEKLKWKCLKDGCGEEFKMTWDSVYGGYNCPYCSGRKVGLSNCLATKNPELAKEWHPTKNGDLTPYDFTANSSKKIWWKCKKGHEWKISIDVRNRGNGCPYCAGQLPSKDYNLLIVNPELCKEWDYEKNDKKPEEYCPNSNQYAWWKCKKGHEWKSIIANRNKGENCPNCRESKGEKKISIYFDNLNILYISQYTFYDLMTDKNAHLKFDFAVFNKNNELLYLIEYDGLQHFEPVRFGGISLSRAIDNLKLVQQYDLKKNIYCKKNNIPLLRIPYWEYANIESILNETFKDVSFLI